MLFLSRYAGYVRLVAEPVFHLDPRTGIREQIKPALNADFRDASVAGSMLDDEGTTRHAVRGGSFDTDEAAVRLGWSEEDKERVEQVLLKEASTPGFNDYRLWTAPVPVAPFPSYDDSPAGTVVQVAVAAGLVREALEYEQATKARQTVLDGLRKALPVEFEAHEVEEALTAA